MFYTRASQRVKKVKSREHARALSRHLLLSVYKSGAHANPEHAVQTEYMLTCQMSSGKVNSSRRVCKTGARLPSLANAQATNWCVQQVVVQSGCPQSMGKRLLVALAHKIAE